MKEKGKGETREKEDRKRSNKTDFLKRCKIVCLSLLAEMLFYHFQ